MDDQGREVLSYLPGASVMRPWPPTFRSSDGIRQVARIVREYHEAVAGFVPPKESTWFNGRAEPLPGEIILHGDLGPWNLIVDDKATVAGIIDWDFARPGPAISGISYLAFYLAPLTRDEIARSAGFDTSPDRRARLEVMAEEYGTDPIRLATEGWRMELEQLYRVRSLGPTGVEPWAGFLRRGMNLVIELDLEWLHSNLASLMLAEP